MASSTVFISCGNNGSLTQLFLAVWTEKRGPTALCHTLYGDGMPFCQACWAGLPFPAIDKMQGLESPWLAISVYIVPQCGASGCNSRLEYLHNEAAETFCLRLAQTVSGPCGMDAGPKQGFADIDVPQSDNPALVQQGILDRHPCRDQGCRKGFCRKLVRKRFHSQMGKLWLLVFLFCLEETDHTETSGIHQGDTMVVAGPQDEMLMLAGWQILAGRVDEQPAGHAQMYEKGPAMLEIHQNIFGTTSQLDDRLMEEDCGETWRKRQTQVRPVDLHAGQAVPLQRSLHALENGFNFWEFWHKYPQ